MPRRFSASPTYQMSRRILGVSPATPGFGRIAFSPDLAGLENARGRVPTPHGEVEVTLRREGGGFIAEASFPGEVEVDVAAAPGLDLIKRSGANRGLVAHFGHTPSN